MGFFGGAQQCIVHAQLQELFAVFFEVFFRLLGTVSGCSCGDASDFATLSPANASPASLPLPPACPCVCSSRVVITSSAVNRGPKRVDLKSIVDEACQKAAANGYRDVSKILVFEKSALPRCVFVC